MAKIGGYTLALDMTDRQAQVLKTEMRNSFCIAKLTFKIEFYINMPLKYCI